MGLKTYFMFEAQINYSDILKNSKWVKSYILLHFIQYVIPFSPKIVYIVVCIHPWILKNFKSIVEMTFSIHKHNKVIVLKKSCVLTLTPN